MNAPLLLSIHVFLAVVDDSYILLDLERDKYFSIDRQRAKTLERVVAGWPPCKGTDGVLRTTPSEPRDRSVISTLINQGLLTRDLAKGKQASPISIETPVSALFRRDLTSTLSVTLRDFLAFLHSSARVVTMRRCSSIASIVHRVEKRKTFKAASPNRPDMAEIQRLLAVFETLRPLLPGSYSCLPDSMLFLEFLADYRIYPTWVFGVRIRPWRAHCWLQQSDVVLNDAVERVRNFTPIMAI
jgi:hypothetical protein